MSPEINLTVCTGLKINFTLRNDLKDIFQKIEHVLFPSDKI